jgi:hypothetical protein
VSAWHFDWVIGSQALWSFARAPLAWSTAIVALLAPLVFLRPVVVDSDPGCTDWLWCEGDRLVGVTFNDRPDLALYALLAIPTTFAVFLAARMNARGPNPRAHWYMAYPLLAAIPGGIFGASIADFFTDTSNSFPPAVLLETSQGALVFGTITAFLGGLVILIAAAGWRLVDRLRGSSA